MSIQYVVSARYKSWKTRKPHPNIVVQIDLFEETLPPWNNYAVFIYGQQSRFTESMVLCDKRFALAHPNILPENKRNSILSKLRVSSASDALIIPEGGEGSVAPHEGA